ncbi:hypothetical protein UFOVP747_41 [uncultured Caudovirales phage]|uniref:Uncharacterized protein n=1 Tax=uncultured Caudovirales phage TaxID=2100421 RepID=A0A6J5NBE3_9CAUD|nr:hypothetical protein UFOVP675_58 [uncultured Caudovirales phage]CAB5225523.1 hypothetical protein UFOVP747_41 [uncultured Caudovirales phage]
MNPAELRALAQAATPKVWFADETGFAFGYVGSGDGLQGDVATTWSVLGNAHANAAYIAAAHPAAVLALLDALDAALALLVEAADEIQATVTAAYAGTEQYPDQLRRKDRDMDIVRRIRTALSGGDMRDTALGRAMLKGGAP